jgi:hypothetical protein
LVLRGGDGVLERSQRFVARAALEEEFPTQAEELWTVKGFPGLA